MAKKGITRKKRGSGKGLAWDYFDSRGKRITSQKVIERCNKLVLPPAWVNVWISPDPNADLQATGVDAKGRRQYRYHVDWTKARAEEKFDSMTGFAKILPTIRKKVTADLRLRGMPKDKVVALIVTLIDRYHFRVGNDEYAKANKSYGLTTMKEGHMVIDRSRNAEGKHDAIFEFMGKSGKLWKRRIWEDDLVALIIASGKVGGASKKQDLFRYEDEDRRRPRREVATTSTNISTRSPSECEGDRQGFSNVGRDMEDGASPVGAARSRHGCGEEESLARRHQDGLLRSRQHTRRLRDELHPSRHLRRLEQRQLSFAME